MAQGFSTVNDQSLEDATDADLRTAGWQRCCIADEPRLSEAVETYEDLGFEVIVLPVRTDDGACNACMRANPDAFRIIYVRKSCG